MALTKTEIEKLEAFKNLNLGREQVEIIISRKLTDKEWELFTKDYHEIFTPIAKKAAKVATKKGYLKPNYKDIFRNLADQEIKRQYGIKVTKPVHSNKNALKAIGAQAAFVARQKNRTVHESQDHPSKDEFKIINITQYYSERYKTNVSTWKITGEVDLFNIHNVIVKLIETMTEHLPSNTRIQISIRTPSGREPHTALLTKDEIINLVTKWVEFFIDYYDIHIEDIIFKLTAIELPQRTGRANAIITLDNKRSITKIANKDSLCLVRAIIVALTYNVTTLQQVFQKKLTIEEINNLNKGRKGNKTNIHTGIFSDSEIKDLRHVPVRKIQTVLAQAFHRIYNIPIKDTGNDFSDIKSIEEKLEVEIQVYDLSTRKIYAGVQRLVKLYLLLDNNHYNVISKLPAFLGSKARSWEAKEKLKCEACKNPTQCNKESKIKCQTCGKVFYSQSCFTSHINNNKCINHSYVCQKCFRCFKVKTRRREDHRCGEKFCSNCKEWYIDEHKCYMQIKKLKEPSEKYIFFDFETLLKLSKHIVNFCVAQYFNGDEHVFTTVDQFCNWVFNKHHKDYTVIAHYGKGYDFQFVQEWLVSHGVKPTVILNGQKLLQLEVKRDVNIRFIDSISFTMQALRDFPKTFGLIELAKGYFPNEFNKPENQDYIGKYPSKEHYGYKNMTKKNKEDFDKWYDTVKDETFDFKKEMYKYCKSDVDILRRGCLKLRELFMQISNIDPFQYITIASVCHAIYRNEFLPANTIGVINEFPTDNYSIKSIKWLKYMSLKYNTNIRHACHGGEQRIVINNAQQLKVDGFCAESNTIYQFHGCYFHGCSHCYNDLIVNKVSGIYMYKLYDNTKRIDDAIKKAGYNLVTIWEHEFDSNMEMKNISLSEYDLVEPLSIRESFFGGRCEPIKLLHDFKTNNQKGRYIDVVSLYPTVMYYDKYPIGHPITILKPKAYDLNWFGFVYCKVIPPKGLYQPVLPYKQKTKQAHKLLFGLCRTCMSYIDLKCIHYKNEKCKQDCNIKQCKECKSCRKLMKQNCSSCYNIRNGECFHSDEERAITGVWCTNEIEMALNKGYMIEYIYEVQHFENTSSDLWKEYIKKFMKIKLETSNYDCSEEEYRSKARQLGIELGNIKFNPGLRFIAKTCLVSLWGKFGQVPKHTQNKYIDTEEDFYKTVLNDKIESLSLSFLNDLTVYASYETKDQFVGPSYNTNI